MDELSFNHRPVWSPVRKTQSSGFQEVWYLKLNDENGESALWIRFTLLVSANGLGRNAETWAVIFERDENGEIQKQAIKKTYGMESFRALDSNDGISIENCEFASRHSKGSFKSENKTIEWDLQFEPASASQFNFVPEGLAKAGLIKNMATTVAEDLYVSGTCTFNGKSFRWEKAKGMQGHLAGSRNGHSWIWGHCNSFADANGNPVDFVFDGLRARARLTGALAAPPMTLMFFQYKGKAYRFNSVWNSIRLRTSYDPTSWTFRAAKGDISFRGQISAKIDDFAGLAYEDTDGSFLYCANSKLSNMSLTVYKKGKLEDSFTSKGTTAFEVVTRRKNPQVAILI